MWTGIIAFVFFVILFFISEILIFKFSSTLTIIGIAPTSKIASTVAIKLNAWVMTSSPGFTPMDLRATFIAAVPEVTANVYFDLKN